VGPDYPWGATEEDWLRFIEDRGRLWGTPDYLASAVEISPGARARRTRPVLP
jgi:hypothetical protein